MNGLHILGTGRALPANIVTNDDLALRVETSDEWIVSRTGIRERRFATHETLTQLAVEAARARQRERYENYPGEVRINANLNARTLDRACPMTDKARALLELSSEKLNFSNRAYTRILKVARTIADLAEEDVIGEEHVSEAVQYRTLDRKYWG